MQLQQPSLKAEHRKVLVLGIKKLSGEKRSSLFFLAVTDTGKKFYNLDTWFVRSSQCQKGIDMPWMIASLVPMLKKFFVVS